MDTLYHYCPTQAFYSIIQTRTIWLSSLTLSNDSMEGKLVTKTLKWLAQRDGLDQVTMERLQASLLFLEDHFDGLGFCLSEESDLLSQWRGYADDASGVSIGFSKSYLEAYSKSLKEAGSIGFMSNRVEYSAYGHESLVEPTYREVKKFIAAGAYKQIDTTTLLHSPSGQEIEEERKQINNAHSGLFMSLLHLVPSLFFLKAHAFAEEKEWRLVSLLLRETTDDCLYRPSVDRVIPYRKFELPQTGLTPIEEIVLGPKHQTPIPVIQAFLKGAGFGDVGVRRSEASYR